MSDAYRQELTEMLDEWSADIARNHTNRSPSVLFKYDWHDFDSYITLIDSVPHEEDGIVPATTFFCLDRDRNRLVGAVNIRHFLNEGLLFSGGHIGSGIRPSERGKGYGTAMTALALRECKKLGITRVLMCCDRNNLASARVIVKNGGVLENEVWDEDHFEQRYWIKL